ncbi:MAG: STAS/SEC14 domain-containing protein [Longimicrobiales bacterium]|nr:STAS/SEC14 domain-containing protein [Longimicrobiales bacterium]
MPVHLGVYDTYALVTVDGDFTAREVEQVVARAGERVAAEARDGSRATPSVPVLLDLTGAASLALKSDEDLATCAAAFAAAGDHFPRVAILVPGDRVDDLMRMGTAFMSQAGLRAAPFRSRAEAEAWLQAPP